MTQLKPSGLKLAEYQRSVFVVVPEEDTPFEALLDERYWAQVSHEMRIGSRIEVYPPRGDYFAELIVQNCGRLFAKVAVLRKVDLQSVDINGDEALDDYKLKYSGPNALWCVIRLADKVSLKTQCATREEAHAWLLQHVKVVGRKVA